MKKWNKIGIIKAAVIAIFSLILLLNPSMAGPNKGLWMLFAPLLVGLLAVPISLNLSPSRAEKTISKPSWNDNPFELNRPLSGLHFAVYFFVAIGLCMILGTSVKYHDIDYSGLMALNFGVGILLGIFFQLKGTKKKE